MTRAAAVRACAGAALRGALAWAVPAGLAGMAWASHYSVWEWAVWRAEGLRLPLPPPFPVWLVGNLAWPWHILEYSPWWPELGFGPARWPAHLWHDYAARAWQAPAAGAVPGALLGLRRGLARVRHPQGSAPTGVSERKTAHLQNNTSIPPGAPDRGVGGPDTPVGPTRTGASPETEGPLAGLLHAVGRLGRDPEAGRDWTLLGDIAAHPAVGGTGRAGADAALPVLAEALRRSGQWESTRRDIDGTKVRLWRRSGDPESPDQTGLSALPTGVSGGNPAPCQQDTGMGPARSDRAVGTPDNAAGPPVTGDDHAAED